MKILIFILKVFLDAYRDTYRVVKYFKLILINGLIIVPKIYYIRLIYTFNFLRNLIKINIKNNFSFNDYFEDANINSKNLTEKIDKDGHTDTFLLKKKIKDKILKEIFSNKDIDYKKNFLLNRKSLVKKDNEDLSLYFRRLSNDNISRITGFIDLKKESSIKSFLVSKPMVSLAQNYLNSKTFSISSSFFISNPCQVNKEEQYKNAQYFHWDNDFSKFLKLYIYLTDVDEDSGPHIFIPKTHKKKFIQTSLCRLYDDNLIYNTYDKKIKFVGKSGSLFFADGYGLHKGETPKKKSRLIINAHFGRNKILYSDKDIFYDSNFNCKI